MEQKIKSNHPFTIMQLHTLNKELKKISNTQIVSLKAVVIKGNPNYSDIQILKSAYTLDVFLSFTDVSIPEEPKFNTYKIDASGKIDYEPKRNMNFKNISDRVSFFNTLEPIKFYT